MSRIWIFFFARESHKYEWIYMWIVLLCVWHCWCVWCYRQTRNESNIWWVPSSRSWHGRIKRHAEGRTKWGKRERKKIRHQRRNPSREESLIWRWRALYEIFILARGELSMTEARHVSHLKRISFSVSLSRFLFLCICNDQPRERAPWNCFMRLRGSGARNMLLKPPVPSRLKHSPPLPTTPKTVSGTTGGIQNSNFSHTNHSTWDYYYQTNM